MKLETPGISPIVFDNEGHPIPVTMPVGPPTRVDGTWEIGQSGDRRLTLDEAHTVRTEMQRRRDAYAVRDVNGPSSDPDAYQLLWVVAPECVWELTFRVCFKNGEVEEAPLQYFKDDGEEAYQFFCGRIHWWWFLGDHVEKVGNVFLIDPQRVTAIE